MLFSVRADKSLILRIADLKAHRRSAIVHLLPFAYQMLTDTLVALIFIKRVCSKGLVGLTEMGSKRPPPFCTDSMNHEDKMRSPHVINPAKKPRKGRSKTVEVLETAIFHVKDESVDAWS